MKFVKLVDHWIQSPIKRDRDLQARDLSGRASRDRS